MSLKKYAEKRKFSQTPEPAPGNASSAPSQTLQFCVQRHHASHLHYDLRLEVDGALKSWAVPKGPTLDPEIKRLAMMVEDHPMDYGNFEGVIPKGNYGAGSVMLWDRGTYELLGDATADQQLTRGDFKFRLIGKKLAGEFAIVRTKRGKGNEWLLIKKKDAAARPGWDPEDHSESVLTGRTQEEIARDLPPVKASLADPAAKVQFPRGSNKSAMPKLITPMLAVLGKGTPPAGGDAGWVYEIKWDGVRAICFLESGKLRMISRNGNSIDKQYPELSVLPHHVHAQEAVLDGEIAALDAQGRPSFELLQRRINVAEPSAIARLARAHPVVFYAFDLLYLDGHDLRSVPLTGRKKLLESILDPSETIRYSEHFATDGEQLLEAARDQGLEGIIGKRAASKYESRRTSDWVKWKVSNSSDFVICGFTPGEREGLGALILGTRILGTKDEGKLKWSGNVGTGFDNAMVRTLQAKLEPLVTRTCPLIREAGLPKNAKWVKPELICEVKFANMTEEGRLRAPVFLGLRNDLVPEPAAAALLDPSAKEASLTIDGHPLKFTNLDKVFYPKDGYRKRDLLNYYDAVAPLLLPYLKHRPLSLKRYPNGIDKPFFFQKQIAESFPKWLHTQVADEIEYVIGDDRATLLYLVNLGCIDHNPRMSRVGSLEYPDYLLIDLDPHECGYNRIVDAALWARGLLDKIGLEGFPKTTGGDGMHIFVPLEPVYTYEQVRTFAQGLAAIGAAERPDLFTTPRTVSKREKGKVYFDWQQIAEGKTISAPYVLRAYPGAPVAAPLSWSEVTPRLRPEQFHLGNALERFAKVGDLFEGVLSRPQRIEAAVGKLAHG